MLCVYMFRPMLCLLLILSIFLYVLSLCIFSLSQFLSLFYKNITVYGLSIYLWYTYIHFIPAQWNLFCFLSLFNNRAASFSAPIFFFGFLIANISQNWVHIQHRHTKQTFIPIIHEKLALYHHIFYFHIVYRAVFIPKYITTTDTITRK